MNIRYPALQGKRDANEPEIIKALLAVGASVEQLPTGRGVPDLLCGYMGMNYLLEVKTETGQLNAKQIAWHGSWHGKVSVVRTPAEALKAIGVELDERCRLAGL